MSVTDEIKARIDIVSYVQRHVPELKKAGRSYKACCPFHSENTPSFVVNPERQYWHCFGACSEGGDIFTFAQKFHNWDFREALRELAAEAGVELRQQTPQQREKRDQLERMRGLLASAATAYHERLKSPDAAAVLEYATQDRGLSRETIDDFQLGCAPDSWDFIINSLRTLGHGVDEIIEAGLAIRSETGRVYDRFRNRLLFPICDERGAVVGFGGRAMDPGDQAKYINTPQTPLFEKSRLLYALDRAKSAIRDSETAVIVEGYMDAVQAHQAGYQNVVAQMGTSLTEDQLRRIAPRHAKRLVLALDSDQAGINASRRSLEVARQSMQLDAAGRLSVDVRVLQAPQGKDPDDFLRASPEAWASLVESAQPVADFVIALETAELADDASVQERQAMARQVLPLLQASEDNLYRQENLQKLARRLRLRETDVLAWAAAQPQPRPTQRQQQPPEALPPEYWDNEYDDTPPEYASPPPTRTVAPSTRAAETYCLSLLLQEPELLRHINRRFRELAGDDADLLIGPLGDLCAADFSGSHYRALMNCLQAALAQHDQEPRAFVLAHTDEALLRECRALMGDELPARSRLKSSRFQVDVQIITSQPPWSNAGLGPPQRLDLVQRALQLRRDRLEQERVEMQYLQEASLAVNADEAGSAVDAIRQPLLSQLNKRIMLSLAARAKLDRAISSRP